MSITKFIFLPIIEEKEILIIQNPYINTLKEYLDMKKIDYKLQSNNLIIQKNNLCENNINKIEIILRLKRDEILQQSIIKNYI